MIFLLYVPLASVFGHKIHYQVSDTKSLKFFCHENQEIDDNLNVPNDVSNISNIKLFGDDYEKEISHFDIYDLRNQKNLDNI